VIQKLRQRLAALLRILRGICKFLEIFDAGEGFGRAFFFERADVAGAIDEELDELGQSGGVAGGPEAGDGLRLCGIVERRSRSLGCGRRRVLRSG
jgi:hypothetical protein